ncbi:Dynein light chain cytoplasmic [Fasciola hepatica]|uniref:Dynein light chain n=1 Tax=Fasciola hepatica TaxID=6192 RepID=A0A4E0RD30_FASHE|nr:Dynein light chain cytoplasmic [Fasciola hepatica]
MKTAHMASVEERALVKYSEMGQQQQQEAVDCCAAALERFEDNQEVAKYIKHEFDRRYGGTWHCVVGKTFGCYVSHIPNSFIYFILNKKAILLFQAKGAEK